MNLQMNCIIDDKASNWSIVQATVTQMKYSLSFWGFFFGVDVFYAIAIWIKTVSLYSLYISFGIPLTYPKERVYSLFDAKFFAPKSGYSREYHPVWGDAYE